jgi:hypothetical protein
MVNWGLAACPSVDDPNDISAILRHRPRGGRPISEQIDEVSADNQRPYDCGTFVDGSDMIHRNRNYQHEDAKEEANWTRDMTQPSVFARRLARIHHEPDVCPQNRHTDEKSK